MHLTHWLHVCLCLSSSNVRSKQIPACARSIASQARRVVRRRGAPAEVLQVQPQDVTEAAHAL